MTNFITPSSNTTNLQLCKSMYEVFMADDDLTMEQVMRDFDALIETAGAKWRTSQETAYRLIASGENLGRFAREALKHSSREYFAYESNVVAMGEFAKFAALCTLCIDFK